MNFSVQVIVHPEDDTEASPVVREVFTLDRDDLAPDTVGLQLAEAKDLLEAVQDTVAGQQATAAIAKQVAWRRTRGARGVAFPNLSRSPRRQGPGLTVAVVRDLRARDGPGGSWPRSELMCWPGWCSPGPPPA
jgi:hypothetical protein